jgi:hypothetical protein
VPKPGPGNRAGFFIARTRGTPKNALVFWGSDAGESQREAFLAAASPHPKPQNQQRSEENAPISERPKRKSSRPAAEGAAENIAKRAAQLAEDGNVAAIRILKRARRQAAGGAHDCARQRAS